MMTRHLFHCVKLAFRMYEGDGEKVQGILQKKIAKAYHVKNYFSFSSSVIFQFSFFPPSHPSTASEISVHDESHGTHLKNILPPSPKNAVSWNVKISSLSLRIFQLRVQCEHIFTHKTRANWMIAELCSACGMVSCDDIACVHCVLSSEECELSRVGISSLNSNSEFTFLLLAEYEN